MKTKGIYFLYRLLQAILLPLVLFYFLYRGFKNRAYWTSLPQRFGFLPHSFRETAPGSIWLHAVSVGEILSCIEYARRLRAEFPHSHLYVSTSTITGHAAALDKLRDTAHGIFYAPIDTVWAIRRVLRTLRPAIVLIAETEIWPNLFREIHRTGAGLAIVNGRISDKALPRYLKYRAIFPHVLSAADSILVQTPDIRDRFLSLGAAPDRIHVSGNFKYDFDPRPASSDSPVPQWLAHLAPTRVFIAASTTGVVEPGDPDEDDVVIAAWLTLRERIPDAVLILVPRKPERFDVVAGKLAAAGIPFERRTTLANSGARVLLLDTIGELGALFAYADVVFMGGTLPRRGGHNILEPALFGKPVIIGPHMENFQAIADDFLAARACVSIQSSAQLAPTVELLLRNPDDLGERARACAEAKRGATARAVNEARAIQKVPRYRPAMPWYAIASAFSWIWARESRRRARRDYLQRRRLPARVISVGNITMGGTGKTPTVLRLAELLRERGQQPAILTRGYGRSSPVKSLILAPGQDARVEATGDEPQIFLRSGIAPIGIGADRYETGSLLLQEFHSDTILLDDGFQHVRLARDLDILLVDAVHPWSGGRVFPTGRLREPLDGLARAHTIIITRGDSTDLVPAIEREIRRYNPSAPIAHARVVPECWVDARSGANHALDALTFERPGAFCGLGNPQGFRRTLERLGIKLHDWVEFEDHHRYTPGELQRMAGQFRAKNLTALLTTEKDAVNLAPDCNAILHLPLYWLKIRMEFDRDVL